MEEEVFKKIEKKIKSQDFYTEFKTAAIIAKKVSFIGNFFSILFAYFFVFNIANSIILEPTFWSNIGVIIVTLLILIGSEAIKRFVFDEFTKSFIRNEYSVKLQETKVLLVVSLMLISLSFYLSLNGAKEYANKNDDIKNIMNDNIEYYEDSVKTLYDSKIAKCDSIIIDLVNQNKTYDNTIKSLNDKNISIEGNGWKENNERKGYIESIKLYSKDKDRNDKTIGDYNIKIKELKEEYEKEINKFTIKQTEQADNTIKETSNTPIRFLIFSIIIEFVILFGIWFINYFDYRSYMEQKEKRKKDPKYKQYLLWKEIIDVFYTGDNGVGYYIPFKSELIKVLKINAINIQNKDLDDAFKIMTQLGILLNKGKRKELLVEYEEAVKKIKEHFKIE